MVLESLAIDFLVVQQLRVLSSNAGSVGFHPVQKIPFAVGYTQLSCSTTTVKSHALSGNELSLLNRDLEKPPQEAGT